MQEDGQGFGGTRNGQSTDFRAVEPVAAEQWRYGRRHTSYDAEDETAILEGLRQAAQAPGQAVHAFEQEVAKHYQVKHAIAVASGPAALHLALLAAEVGHAPGDEVVQPALNIPGAANMTVSVGAQPVFADIVSLTEPTMDPEDAAGLIGPNTRALVAMHYGGYPARLEALVELCELNNITLIEHASCGLGVELAELNQRALGTVGKIGCFSFGLGPCSPGSEAGLLVTNDDVLAARIRSLMWQAFPALNPNRQDMRTTACDLLAHGVPYRMSDLCATLALREFTKLKAATAVRQRRAQAYANVVETFSDGTIEYVFGWAPAEGNAQMAAILVEPSLREGLRAYLTAMRIETRLHYPPLPNVRAFAECRTGNLTHTRAFAERVVTLPISASLPAKAPEHIIRLCATYLASQASAPPKMSKPHLRVVA